MSGCISYTWLNSFPSLSCKANEDNGFRRKDLDKFLKRGGFRWLPKFLHGQVNDEENWHEFLVDTVERCLEFVGYINVFVASLYLLSLLSFFAVLPSKNFGLQGLGGALARSGLLYSFVFVLWMGANHHVDNTDWAKDIRAGRRYSVDFGAEEMLPDLSHLPSTFPNRKDVLIETRYGSRQFHMYNDFTNDDPGTRTFRELVREYSEAYSQVESDFFQNATAAYVVGAVSLLQGRFLFQHGNIWRLLPDGDAIEFVKSELAFSSSPIMNLLRQEFRYLHSEYKYGFLRNTALALKSIVDLDVLKVKVLKEPTFFPADATTRPLEKVDDSVASSSILRREQLAAPRTVPLLPDPLRQRRVVNIGDEPGEPEYGAWLKDGDAIEAAEELDDGTSHWYRCVINKVDASGNFFVVYDDDSFGIVWYDSVRVYEPYYVGEHLEVLMEDDAVEDATIITDYGDGTYDVLLEHDGEVLLNVASGDMRRLNEDVIEEE